MSSITYAVLGAAGNTGRPIAEGLLARGKKVRVFGRDPKKLERLVSKGAQPFVGDLEDEDALIRCITGAEAAYTMIPTNIVADDIFSYYSRVGSAITNALSKSGVNHVVNLSSVGAHLSERTGPVAALHEQEQRLNKLHGIDIIHLRPTSFMENLFGSIPTIKAAGTIYDVMNPEQRHPMIATVDVAAEATRLLLDLNFSGISFKHLFGQRDLSMAEVTVIIGKAIGRNLNYVQVSPQDGVKGLMEMGLSRSVSESLIELGQAIDSGFIFPDEKRTEQNTTPTSFEEFSKTFTAVYQNS
jgi:uncharacterized protein YbjT (DUF2867 family)